MRDKHTQSRLTAQEHDDRIEKELRHQQEHDEFLMEQAEREDASLHDEDLDDAPRLVEDDQPTKTARPVTTKTARGNLGREDWLAIRFVEEYGDTIRYVAGWGKWFEWNGVRWREEKTLKVLHQARALLRPLTKLKASDVAAVVKLAMADRRFAATTDQWDGDPWLLGTPQGIVDLHDGELQRSVPEDYVTKRTAVAPDWDCPTPRWTRFLREITDGDVELQQYLRRLFGYCLTGDVREDALPFFWGSGGNGKGVLLQTVAWVMGDYHRTAPTEMFMVSKGDRHPAEWAMLQGARLVTATEVDENATWNKAAVTKLTGRDPIPARFMRQNWFEFPPTHKLGISGNHKPKIGTVDDAIRRRMQFIPFLVQFAQPDRRLPEKLKREAAGILAWLIDGCLAWQRGGLKPPKAVVEATREYLNEEDALGQWLQDCCQLGKSSFSTSFEVWQSWQKWAKRAGEEIGSRTGLGRRLGERQGIRRDKNAAGDRGFYGLRVLR